MLWKESLSNNVEFGWSKDQIVDNLYVYPQTENNGRRKHGFKYFILFYACDVFVLSVIIVIIAVLSSGCRQDV